MTCQDGDNFETDISCSLSGITRTGSMGLISACIFKAPLLRHKYRKNFGFWILDFRLRTLSPSKGSKGQREEFKTMGLGDWVTK